MMGWASYDAKPHEWIWNDDSSHLGLAVLNDFESKPFVKRLSCTTYIGSQLRQTGQPCLSEKVIHEGRSDTASGVIARYKEVVNVPVCL